MPEHHILAGVSLEKREDYATCTLPAPEFPLVWPGIRMGESAKDHAK
tara:strand:+ start:10416 stop:10556 length:141 start_codon:yes stop_codon:yes gene_type:complete